MLHPSGTNDIKAYKVMEKAVKEGNFLYSESGIVVQGWYLMGGRGYRAELLSDKVISQIAEAHGKSSAQVIPRWNLQKGVVVISGSSNPEHIQENTEIYDFELTDEEMERTNALDRNEKHDWY